MSSHEREFTILPSEGSVVVPTASVTDTFRLQKQSDSAQFSVEDVTIKPHIIPDSYKLSYEGLGSPVTVNKLHDLKSAVKNKVPLHCHSIQISVTFTVAAVLSFPEGKAIVTELTASLTHETHAETITTSVINVVGSLATDPIAEVGVLAGTLYNNYEEFDALPDRDIQKALKNADTTVASIVNSAASINVQPNVFAQALAIHDLIDDLYGKLLERAQPPELVDAVP